ncbi:hypothetical protein A2V61_03945 [Candidatus Woesebacteria bacterium RBG_19FT_COMBO_47_8]|uniref:Uncharacterized protein n=1 Tax=Candidatus Woesebacteria bacterium RBG_13_46_13 TaxID=1802479 RepID=A0A1F7X5K9_9BACT|nr:MAG: hypothetical protein A2Y68_01960 [Candidatus Woesebacteria bacterium RBG_13_46_13]OGM16815.1 MAG: hypothetical protein A2V61_03945 [Candidatus Woesebacteria bacterium RBG_19FT_COMBO_47_8]HJX59349.1 hypothetical protein [Patescibacteria group bacterium]
MDESQPQAQGGVAPVSNPTPAAPVVTPEVPQPVQPPAPVLEPSPQVAPVSPTPKKPNLVLIIGTIVLILAIVALAGFYFLNTKKTGENLTTPEVTPTIIEQGPTITPTETPTATETGSITPTATESPTVSPSATLTP